MKRLFLLMLTIMVTTVAFGQERMSVVSGNFEVLKDQTEVNVEVQFENVLFMKENITETQYLENRKKQVLENPKRGEEAWKTWIAEWEKYKKEEYVQYFANGLNKTYKEISFKKDNAAKYTLLLDTKWVFPGWHAGLTAMTAEISGTIKLVETNNPSVVLAEVALNKFDRFVHNDQFVMEYGRIAAAYESVGRTLGKKMKKSLK
ncbi:hypothetical protein BBH99_01810 [Chryseobacterium contaminans]|uniref:DUF4468 domain-containing protein n=1 Tax=Chryseobacterium contaminans TaxID=1423959 RepID=A0A1M7IDW4_9FLAO|nr:hypothetical protein [Chryseobacterium contaminans]OCA78039.1 hypothetical protein BBH99_01810 [Chryseobacterium contaminans]SHM38880.1 hypothetical protein SAMN05444407_11452 [Chryseobacterium contaminans]